MTQAHSQGEYAMDNRTRFGLLTLVFASAVVLPTVLVATGLSKRGSDHSNLFVTFMVPTLLSFVGYIAMLSVRRPAPVTVWAKIPRVVAAALLLIPTLFCGYTLATSIYRE